MMIDDHAQGVTRDAELRSLRSSTGPSE
jgi:hypothetical protein